MEAGGRCVVDHLLSPGQCSELVFILNSLAVDGNREGVQSATIHDVAYAQPGLLSPLLGARGLIQEAVEKAMGREMELFPEFTALMDWGEGSSIEWHFDANRPYLEARHYSAVLYLNDTASDFGGGTLRFQQGEPPAVVPQAGRLVAYGSGCEHIHCVDRVTWGHRMTMTMWFTLEPSASEDPHVLRKLEEGCMRARELPEEMFIRKDGTDVRLTRLRELGFEYNPTTSPGDDGVAAGGRIAHVGQAGDSALCLSLGNALQIASFHHLVSRSEEHSLPPGSAAGTSRCRQLPVDQDGTCRAVAEEERPPAISSGGCPSDAIKSNTATGPRPVMRLQEVLTATDSYLRQQAERTESVLPACLASGHLHVQS